MFFRPFAATIVFLCFFFSGADDAAAQPFDQWHYINEDSILHSETVAGLHGAGVIQSNQIFAMLYLGLPGENGVVTVVLPLDAMPETMTSALVLTNGQRFSREIPLGQIDRTELKPNAQALTFPISDMDVDLFKRAITWHIGAGDSQYAITLKGSRKAIEKAELEQTLQLSALIDSENEGKTGLSETN